MAELAQLYRQRILTRSSSSPRAYHGIPRLGEWVGWAGAPGSPPPAALGRYAFRQEGALVILTDFLDGSTHEIPVSEGSMVDRPAGGYDAGCEGLSFAIVNGATLDFRVVFTGYSPPRIVTVSPSVFAILNRAVKGISNRDLVTLCSPDAAMTAKIFSDGKVVHYRRPSQARIVPPGGSREAEYVYTQSAFRPDGVEYLFGRVVNRRGQKSKPPPCLVVRLDEHGNPASKPTFINPEFDFSVDGLQMIVIVGEFINDEEIALFFSFETFKRHRMVVLNVANGSCRVDPRTTRYLPFRTIYHSEMYLTETFSADDMGTSLLVCKGKFRALLRDPYPGVARSGEGTVPVAISADATHVLVGVAEIAVSPVLSASQLRDLGAARRLLAVLGVVLTRPRPVFDAVLRLPAPSA